MRDPHSGQRQPGAGHRGVAAASGGETESEALGGVQGVLVPSCQLEDGPRVAVVRFYNKRGTSEQWMKEDKQAVKMTRLKLSPVPIERSASVPERDPLQPGEPVAAAGAAEENRQVVAHPAGSAA
ncbi:MAG TPA: hypothetical protein VGS27_02890 [Candidatus Sulfotelmatobacter sp.]|nr:hypothetical protein [Candidatus Sulfotelmatobacter sp.]